MRTVTFELVGISPYSQSKVIQSVRDDLEPHEKFEERTWRERMHVLPNGNVCIESNTVKNTLSACAKFLSMSVKGKGKATYTKHFEAGVLCTEPIDLNIKAAEVKGERLFVPADGQRGSGKRVWKIFPYIPPGWTGIGTALVMDETITDEIFETHLRRAGQYIGFGRFRPRNNGSYGRFDVKSIRFDELKM